MSHKRELLETWFQRVWTEENSAAIYELFPHGPNHGLGSQQLVGPDEFSGFHSALCEQLRGIQVNIVHCVEGSDGWVSAICTLTANSQVHGNAVTMTGSVFAKVGENDVFLECYNHWDFVSLWAQLGLIPGDVFERSLAGKTTGI